MRLRFRHPSLACLSIIGAAATAMAEPATKEVEVNGVTMSYVEEGTGETVVFVHGAVSDARVWESIRQAISDERRFVAPTLRYFGSGEWLDEGEQFGVATHADDVAAFIKALDVGPVHLVGWSYGGSVATVAALENPDLVRTLTVFEPALSSLIQEGEAGKAAGEAAGQMFGPVNAALEEGDAEKATKLLIEGVFEMPPGGFDDQPQELREMQLENARTLPVGWSAPPREVTCDMLQEFNKPTLIVHGAESNAFWTHIAEVMDECLPQAELVAQPGVNHNGPVRDPAGFVVAIEEFLAKL